MSPEQAKGRPIDKRADIFAFGCVVYEMLTGKRAFDGEDVSEILARVIEREPDWSVLPANTPPGIRRLLKRCLEKNVKERRRDAGDVIADIDDATMDATWVVPERRTNAAISRLGWVAAATTALALAVLGAIHFREKQPGRHMRCVSTSRRQRLSRQRNSRCLRTEGPSCSLPRGTGRNGYGCEGSTRPRLSRCRGRRTHSPFLVAR